jgi:hypothetical protein
MHGAYNVKFTRRVFWTTMRHSSQVQYGRNG